MTYRQVADHAKQRARLRRMSRADQDWPPEFYFLDKRGLHTERVPPGFFRDRETKTALIAKVVVPTIKGAGVTIFAMTLTMMALREDHPMSKIIAEREEAGSKTPTEGLPYFQDVPGAIEALWVHIFDAERHEAWMAAIERSSGPPRLGAFSLAGGAPDTLTGDYFIDPIKAALR